MTNKDVFKILLCSYGYDRNIKIETYHADSLDIGYDIYAENKEGNYYEEANCSGVMFHVFKILEHMKKYDVKVTTNYWNCSIKNMLDDNKRNEMISFRDNHDKELEQWSIVMQPYLKWSKENNPCTNCTINKHDHWDDIHYNCELCHNHTCELLIKFENDSRTIIPNKTNI